MLIKTYEERGLLLNISVKETCSSTPLDAYRGDLVIIEGEVGDATGRRKPPEKMLRQAVLLANASQLRFVSGQLNELLDLTDFFARYTADLAPDTQSLIFVANINAPLQVSHEGKTLYLAPLLDGMVWTELVELATLEKDDLKGLSSADKVLLVSEQLAKNGPGKFTSVALADIAKYDNGKQRTVRGAV